MFALIDKKYTLESSVIAIIPIKIYIRVESSSKRHYPHKELDAHIIGYVSKASKLDIANNEIAKYSGIVGKSGIERYYNEKLQGTLGFKDTKVNDLNKEIEVIEQEDPSNDHNVRIKVDVNFQKYIQ